MPNDRGSAAYEIAILGLPFAEGMFAYEYGTIFSLVFWWSFTEWLSMGISPMLACNRIGNILTFLIIAYMVIFVSLLLNPLLLIYWWLSIATTEPYNGDAPTVVLQNKF